MSTYEQIELDLRLDYERSLKENIQKTAEFAQIQIMEEEGPKSIESQHEAYGVMAEKYGQIGIPVKAAAGNMKDMLNMLAGGDIKETLGSLYNSCVDIAVKAVVTAAHCRRALDDLYYSAARNRSPLEEWADGQEDFDDFEAADEEGTAAGAAEDASGSGGGEAEEQDAGGAAEADADRGNDEEAES